MIILDEPTVGPDPLQIIEIRQLIKQPGKDHTVILSSQILYSLLLCFADIRGKILRFLGAEGVKTGRIFLICPIFL